MIRGVMEVCDVEEWRRRRWRGGYGGVLKVFGGEVELELRRRPKCFLEVTRDVIACDITAEY